jgi:hypothetical protein
VSVFPAIDSTAMRMSFCSPQIYMHFIHSLRVSSCVSISIFSVYFVLSFLRSPYHAVLQRSKKSFEFSLSLCWSAAISLNFCVSLTTLSNLSRRGGFNSFQLAADAGSSSWSRSGVRHLESCFLFLVSSFLLISVAFHWIYSTTLPTYAKTRFFW